MRDWGKALLVVAVIAGVLFFGTMLAECAEKPKVKEEPRLTLASVALPTLFYSGHAAGDLHTTHLAEREGAVEANPFLQSNRTGKKALHTAGILGVDLALQSVGSRRSRKVLPWVWRGTVLAGNILVYRHNLKVRDQARRWREAQGLLP